MVAKWIAIAIIVGLIVAMIPVAVVALWTLNKTFVATLLLLVLVIGIVALVVRAIDREIEVKRLRQEREEELQRIASQVEQILNKQGEDE